MLLSACRGIISLKNFFHWRNRYGKVLFLDTAEQTPDGNITITFHDTEDCYEPIWDLADMTATDALYMLEELEEIVDFHTEHPDKPVLTEYDADFDCENY